MFLQWEAGRDRNSRTTLALFVITEDFMSSSILPPEEKQTKYYINNNILYKQLYIYIYMVFISIRTEKRREFFKKETDKKAHCLLIIKKKV